MKNWKIDPAHSEIKFKVKHLLVSTVTGSFGKFDAELNSDGDDFENAVISFEAESASINTNNAQRDAHLQSADFFDAENFPKMTFVSKSFKKLTDSNFELTGDMTIRGTTKEVKLNVEYNGNAKGFDGLEVAGFEITGKLNRFDFGLQWNAMTEAGGIVVGPEIKIEIFAEMKESVEVSKAA
ncbi:MAG: YceI family protein [Ignavibacteria bacterium]|nr:YceI family protein [Ignavibacteria bacterium]